MLYKTYIQTMLYGNPVFISGRKKGGNGQKDEAGLDEGCIVDQDVDVSDKEVKQ